MERTRAVVIGGMKILTMVAFGLVMGQLAAAGIIGGTTLFVGAGAGGGLIGFILTWLDLRAVRREW
jgi:hypothetical protein